MSTVKTKLLTGVALMAVPFAVIACGGSSTSSGEAGKVAVVAYSTPEEAYENGLEPGFQKTDAGKDVTFSGSFGPSGDQSRAVEAGLPADLVEFSLATDMERLVDDGIVDKNWQDNPNKGFLTDSVATIVVRPGNPDNIHDWSDLLKPGVQVLTPNPFTSGSARWNIMAVYGAAIKEGKSPTDALADVKQLLANTPVQDASARDALGTFTSGKGDALISYENEAIAAKAAGEKLDYVTPKDTILIQNPVAVTKNASPDAQKFLDYAWSDAGQQELADAGYRPVVKSVFDKNKSKFPIPPDLFTIDDLGGWDKVTDEFFDPDKGSVAKIEEELGVATQ